MYEAAKVYKETAMAQFAHMVVGKACEGSDKKWDTEKTVKAQTFNDFMGFIFSADDNLLKVWQALMKTIGEGKLVKEWAKDKERVAKNAIFFVSCFLVLQKVFSFVTRCIMLNIFFRVTCKCRPMRTRRVGRSVRIWLLKG